MTKKKHSDEFKKKYVARMGKESTSVPALAKEAGVHTSVLYAWRKKFNGATSTKPDKKVSREPVTQDAIIYLKHARDAMNKELREGKVKNLSKSNLLALLALDVLSGDN